MNENILRSIEKGSFMIKEGKKKSEEIFVRLRLESGQIVIVNKNLDLGTKKGQETETELVFIELYQIVDIRDCDDNSVILKHDKDTNDVNKKVNYGINRKDIRFRFKVVHGCQFNLKIISLRAPDTTHYLEWLTGLQFLVEQHNKLSYETFVERWLWKQYYLIGEKVTERGAGTVIEIDDEFILPEGLNKFRCNSLMNIGNSGNNMMKDEKEENKNEKNLKKVNFFSSQRRNFSNPDFKRTQDKSQNSPTTGDGTMLVAKSSFQLNTSHFRRYSWCSNICGSNEFSKQRRFTSTSYHNCDNPVRMFDIKISPKQLRVWLAELNGNKVDLDFFKEYSSNYQPKSNFIDFNGFKRLYRDLLYQPETFILSIEKRLSEKLKEKHETISEISENEFKRIALLHKLDQEWIQMINNYHLTLNLDVSTIDKWFSQSNSIWDPQRSSQIYQDMDQPISEYYISSSHNTYLTGDQITSKSSCEAYVRCIQMGCRSVELDCWNGDNAPIIYHGNTLTSKISLLDVLHSIKKFAWKYSNFPVILSFEDHCDVQQQIVIAQMMQEIFQDDLLISPIKLSDSITNLLPSPNQLKNKIIVKHKKLPLDGDNNAFLLSSNIDSFMENHIYHGRMYMKDLFLNVFIPYYFVLSQSHTLSYSEDNSLKDVDHEHNSSSSKEQIGKKDDDINADYMDHSSYFMTIDQKEKLDNGNCDLLKSPVQSWYYGCLSRSDTNSWLKRHWFMGDGTFIIRESETFPNNYSLSFYRKETIHHVRICKFFDEEKNEISVGFEHCNVKFKTIENLVKYYQENDMVALDFNIKLKNSPPEHFQGKSWFYENPPLNKVAAESLLNQIPFIGSFLVRRKKKMYPSDNCDSNSISNIMKCKTEDHFVVSYKRRVNEINHCTINYDGFKYSIYGHSTYSLVELVEYLSQNEIIDGVKLRYPADADLIKKYNSVSYMIKKSKESNFRISTLVNETTNSKSNAENTILCPSVTADNLLDLHQHQNNLPNHDKLQKSHDVPSNYMGDDDNGNPLGNMQMGSFQLDSDCFVKVGAAINDLKFTEMFPFDLFVDDFHIQLACETEDERWSWMNAINNSIMAKNDTEIYCIYRKKEIHHQIAKPLSDLVIYCSSVSFNWPESPDGFEQLFNQPCQEMSSLNENKFFKLICSKSWISVNGDDNSSQEDITKRNDISASILNNLCTYHSAHFSRVYPKATRLDSSNLYPIIPWLSGVQMVALNFQTPDRSMQINQALFRDNGGCGFIQKNYRVFDQSQQLHINLTFLGARHLPRVSKGLLEIEIISTYRELCDRKVISFKNEVTVTNNDIPDVSFQIKNPNFSFIRFSYGSEEKISQNKRLNSCQTTFPVIGIRPGIRSVHLRNGFDFLYELATILFHVELSIHSAP